MGPMILFDKSFLQSLSLDESVLFDNFFLVADSFLGSRAPFGYRKVKLNDGAKDRPTLQVDPATAPVVREIFESSLRGNGLKEICRVLNDRGIINRGRRWFKGGATLPAHQRGLHRNRRLGSHNKG